MKSLRAQLILSHVLPQVLILPLLVLSLGYLIESQIILVDLANNFRRVAMLAAQDAAARPEIWQDARLAEDFARLLSDTQQREIILLRPDGKIQAAPSGDTGQLARLSPDDLAVLLAGETLVQDSYNLSPDAMHVEALAPVLDAQHVVVGIVRITDRLGNVFDNIRSIRRLEITAALLSLLAAVGMGIWLARRMEMRLKAILVAVEQVANTGDDAADQSFSLERMPRDFARVFEAVSALSNRLHASEDARKRLLANLVHEVARPLGALQAAVHALQRGAVEDPALRQDFLKGMDDQIERLKPLLDNLASLYVLSGQPVELQPEQVHLGEWLREILVTWQVAAETSGLEWQCNLPDDLPVVTLDPNRMAQVIGNLVANAIQYTPEGGYVHVAAGRETSQVWIAVEDTGIGITPEERQKIFEPLYRGPRARRFPQGMGLGLSIAVDIVRLHGGDLQVSSEVGCGSRFTVYLPVGFQPRLAQDQINQPDIAL
jgi:two-component system, OmpR family, sensor histidine kinase BaeS